MPLNPLLPPLQKVLHPSKYMIPAKGIEIDGVCALQDNIVLAGRFYFSSFKFRRTEIGGE